MNHSLLAAAAETTSFPMLGKAGRARVVAIPRRKVLLVGIMLWAFILKGGGVDDGSDHVLEASVMLGSVSMECPHGAPVIPF